MGDQLSAEEFEREFGITREQYDRSQHNNGYRAPEVVARLERIHPTAVPGGRQSFVAHPFAQRLVDVATNEIETQCPQLSSLEREDLARRITAAQLRAQSEALLSLGSDVSAASAIELNALVDSIKASLG
jgi:hypothetical protein